MTTPSGPQPSTPGNPRPKSRTPIDHPADTPGECRASGYVDTPADESARGPAIPSADASFLPAPQPTFRALLEEAGLITGLLMLVARKLDCGMSPGWE